MELIYLDWDSSFLSKKVYRIDTVGDLTEDDLLQLENLEADLIYICVEKPGPHSAEIFSSIGAILYDRKVRYTKKVMDVPGSKGENISFESVITMSPAIESMAYQSGGHSRFKMDPKLRDKFEELYYAWIVKSVDRRIAKEVLVAKNENGSEVGFITLSDNDQIGTIGLIAVDEKFRGMKIASQLLDKADKWFFNAGMKDCEVVTQLDNIPACQLYEKAGYKQKKIEYIYHYWKK